MYFPRRISYFSEELNREVKELYISTALYNLAINLAYIFEPIFLYKLGYSLVQIMIFYIVVYLVYALSIFPVTKIGVRIGYKHSIFISTIFYVGYWILLFKVQTMPQLFLIAPILFGLQKSFFWPPYNSDVALHNIKAQRGRVIGVLVSVIE